MFHDDENNNRGEAMNEHGNEIVEGAKVAVVGAAGLFTSIRLSDVATITSIAVGLATLVYIVAKTYFLIRNRGKGGE